MFYFFPIIVIMLISLLLFLPILLIFAHSLYVVFKKAGKNGISALIPIYNVLVLTEITKLKQFYFFIIISFILLPVVSFGTLSGLGGILSFFGFFSANYNLAKLFGKDEIFYGLGLTILPFIFYPMIAYSSPVYNGDIYVSPYGPIPEETVDNINQTHKNQTSKFCRNCGNNVNNDKFCSKCGTEQK